jgi:hypothetical protein
LLSDSRAGGAGAFRSVTLDGAVVPFQIIALQPVSRNFPCIAAPDPQFASISAAISKSMPDFVFFRYYGANATKGRT